MSLPHTRRKYVTVLELARQMGIPKNTLRHRYLAGTVPPPTIAVGQSHAWPERVAAKILADHQAADHQAATELDAAKAHLREAGLPEKTVNMAAPVVAAMLADRRDARARDAAAAAE